MANKIKKIDKHIDKISNLVKGIKKGNADIPAIRHDLSNIKQLMLQVLEEDERRKSQKKAS